MKDITYEVARGITPILPPTEYGYLDEKELKELWDAHNNSRNGTYPQVSFINNAVYHNWDGTDHYGVIVCVKNSADSKHPDTYFMEQTWTFADDHLDPAVSTYVTGFPKWSKWLPVDICRSKANAESATRRHKIVAEYRGLDMKEFAEMIIDSCVVDDIEWPRYESIECRFTENDLFDGISFYSTTLKEKYNKRHEEIMKSLMDDFVPAGDPAWDDICLGDATDRNKVFNALRKRGHHIYLDGERDSFGWVTLGIIMDGKLMTSCYF